MLKAKFFEPTNLLVVTGDDIKPVQITIEEMEEWNTAYGLDGEPKYDIQLWKDLDSNGEVEYGFQYCTLRWEDDNWHMNNDFVSGELTMVDSGDIFMSSVKIYEKKGQSAVFDYAISIGVNEYKHCDPCATESPVVDDSCLVCGSPIKK